MAWLQAILLAVIALAAVIIALQVVGVRKALDSMRLAILANTARTAEAAEHAERARGSAERAQVSADVVGGYVRELRDAARDVVARKSRSSLPSLSGEEPSARSSRGSLPSLSGEE
jgi:hypothetical protein